MKVVGEPSIPQDISSGADLGVPSGGGYTGHEFGGGGFKRHYSPRHADRNVGEGWQPPVGNAPEIVAPPPLGKVELTEPLLMPTVAMIGSVVPAAAVTRSFEPSRPSSLRPLLEQPFLVAPL